MSVARIAKFSQLFINLLSRLISSSVSVFFFVQLKFNALLCIVLPPIFGQYMIMTMVNGTRYCSVISPLQRIAPVILFCILFLFIFGGQRFL